MRFLKLVTLCVALLDSLKRSTRCMCMFHVCLSFFMPHKQKEQWKKGNFDLTAAYCACRIRRDRHQDLTVRREMLFGQEKRKRERERNSFSGKEESKFNERPSDVDTHMKTRWCYKFQIPSLTPFSPYDFILSFAFDHFTQMLSCLVYIPYSHLTGRFKRREDNRRYPLIRSNKRLGEKRENQNGRSAKHTRCTSERQEISSYVGSSSSPLLTSYFAGLYHALTLISKAAAAVIQTGNERGRERGEQGTGEKRGENERISPVVASSPASLAHSSSLPDATAAEKKGLRGSSCGTKLHPILSITDYRIRNCCWISVQSTSWLGFRAKTQQQQRGWPFCLIQRFSSSSCFHTFSMRSPSWSRNRRCRNKCKIRDLDKEEGETRMATLIVVLITDKCVFIDIRNEEKEK